MSCAPSSIQWYMNEVDRTSGLGGTSRSLFVSILSPCFLQASTGHSFRGILMQFCRHITLGGIQSPSKNFGGRTPLGGKYFPKFFWYNDLKIWGSHAPDPGKNMQKKFLAPDPPGLGGVASKVLELRFLNFSTRLQATVLAIYECKFAGTLP